MSNPRYWREIGQRYTLAGNACGECGEHYFPPREVCPECRRESIGRMQEHTFSGRGTIHSYTVVHDSPAGMEPLTPYALAMVELEEGPKVTSQVVDCDPHEDIEIGTPVKMVFRKMGEEGDRGAIHYGYKFKPVPDGA